MKTITRALFLLVVFVLAGLVAQTSAATSLAQGPGPIIPSSDPSGLTSPDTAEVPVFDGGVPNQFPIVSYQPAESAAPRTSDATITVWYGSSQAFGQLGIPQRWINILGTTTGATSLSYRLNGGDPQPLSIGPDTQRLYDDGSFNVEIGYELLVPGANTVEITASDGVTPVVANVTVNYTPDVVWPRNYSIDWSTTALISNAAQVVDGYWAINGGELRTVVPGYDRTVAIGGLDWTNYEITVPVTVESLNDSEWGPPSNGAGVGFIAGWRGHYALDGEQPRQGWRRALGTIAWYRWNQDNTSGFLMRGYGGSAVLDKSNEQIALNTTYIFKLSVQSSPIEGFPSTYRFKYWPQGAPEPALWTMQGEGIVGEPATGSVLLVAHQAMVRFGNVTVTPIPTANNLKVKAQVSANGTVVIDPQKDTYSYGERVTVRAVGESGFVLSNWSGDLAAAQSENPVVFDVTQDMVFKANFVSGTDPTLSVTLDGNGTVAVKPEKGSYRYGELVTLTPKPNPGFLFAQWGGDLTGSENPADVVMTTSKTISAGFVPANINSPVSDDFNACALNSSLWTFVNPVGDGSYSMTGETLVLNVPEGLSHNIWLEGNRSVRMMQPTANDNFEIVTHFDSVVTQRFQMQGIVVEQDNGNYLRFEIHHDGKTAQAYAATFTDGVPTPVITRNPLASTPPWLRVTRTGENWSFSYSFDGDNWTSAGSFKHALTVASSGVYGGNHNSVGLVPPAHQAVVDYFFNSGSPITPEDGQPNVVDVNIVGEGQVSVSPEKDQYTCGESVTLTANADSGWQFFAWSGDVSGNESQKTLVINGPANVTATFVKQDGDAFNLFLPATLRP